MKFSIDFDSSEYFFDLAALTLVLLPLYFFCAETRVRRWMLILSGLYLVYFIAPRLALLSLLFWLSVFCLQNLVGALERLTSKNPENTSIATLAKLTFTLSILIALTPMLSWKVVEWDFIKSMNLGANALLGQINHPLWEIDLARDIITPVGLSFSTFRAIDLLVKTYIGKLPLLGLGQVLYYGFFPPVLVVGPIIEYEEIREGAEGKLPSPSPEDILLGALRTLWGFFKVLCLASVLQPSAEILHAFQGQDVATVWIYLIAYTWFFYINFSGYSDIAIGLARIYGFKLKENFNNPYFARNVAEFWAGWHMSLYRFARRNVFVPLGGYRHKRHIFALAGTMMTIAIWHALSLSMVLFGLYHTVGLMAHRQFTKWKEQNGVKSGGPALQAASMLATYIFVLLSFPLIALPFQNAVAFYAVMFGIGG